MIKIKRVLISVSDKAGLIDFARGLKKFDVEIISTGGTARLIKNAGIDVREVSDYTGFPEMLDGRIKTLHPKIHAGLLALRENPEHINQLKSQDIGLIDMVVVNLYPFERVIQKKNVTLPEAIENIDIGGPTLIRGAAKNFKNVAVICQPARYKEILKELEVNSGILSDRVLSSLAVEAFQYTSGYDTVIYNYLNGHLRQGDFSGLSRELALRFHKVLDLRYGENPHQAASFYGEGETPQGLAALKKLHGKELSFNNILDLNAAIVLAREFKEPAAVIVKHNNPTGVALGASLSKAFGEALACDTTAAYGGIIGLNRRVDLKTADLIQKSGFMECVVAPDFDAKAFKKLSQKKNLRLVRVDLTHFKESQYDFKRVEGGLLYQESDRRVLKPEEAKIVTKIKPTQSQLEAMFFGFKVVKHVRSNAVVLVKGTKTVGIGCGQTSRIETIALAIRKAGSRAKGAVLVSEAFLPNADNVQAAAKAGIKAIMQTGGSIADAETIRGADKAKIAMVFTGIRHFKH